MVQFKALIMKKLEWFLLVMIIICASCAKDQWFDPPELLPGNSSPYNLISPQIKIAVISDIHYMDPSIVPDDPENNPIWQAMVSHDRKIFELSDPIFRKVVSKLKDEKPDILLITGDLAMEGQLVCHETVKGFLQKLESNGIQVFVVPGNNDIDNPDSKNFKTDPPSSIPSITEDKFVSIYGDFGYDEAIYRDTNSLSYICQPHRKLWILGIDGINRDVSPQKGAINSLTMAWIKDKMVEARAKNIEVLAMMHIGTIEHYTGQKGLEPLISKATDNAIALINSGVRLIFTGHYHANSIVDFTNEGKTLTEIETGSLVTPLSPYRIMTLDDNFINIDTKRVTEIDMELPGGIDFLTYCNQLINFRLNEFFVYVLQNMFKIPEEEALIAAPVCTDALKAYFAGDEKISPAEQLRVDALAESVPSYPNLVNIVNNWWTDLPPSDNKAHIKLK
jgi:3',5'-cyclic AMP phosphodiesterase CpdA